jgi:hypothetical protein
LNDSYRRPSRAPNPTAKSSVDDEISDEDHSRNVLSQRSTTEDQHSVDTSVSSALRKFRPGSTNVPDSGHTPGTASEASLAVRSGKPQAQPSGGYSAMLEFRGVSSGWSDTHRLLEYGYPSTGDSQRCMLFNRRPDRLVHQPLSFDAVRGAPLYPDQRNWRDLPRLVVGD